MIGAQCTEMVAIGIVARFLVGEIGTSERGIEYGQSRFSRLNVGISPRVSRAGALPRLGADDVHDVEAAKTPSLHCHFVL